VSDGLVVLELVFFPDVEHELSHGPEVCDPDVPGLALLGGVSFEIRAPVAARSCN
jgi:hypothetical protein